MTAVVTMIEATYGGIPLILMKNQIALYSSAWAWFSVAQRPTLPGANVWNVCEMYVKYIKHVKFCAWNKFHTQNWSFTYMWTSFLVCEIRRLSNEHLKKWCEKKYFSIVWKIHVKNGMWNFYGVSHVKNVCEKWRVNFLCCKSYENKCEISVK